MIIIIKPDEFLFCVVLQETLLCVGHEYIDDLVLYFFCLYRQRERERAAGYTEDNNSRSVSIQQHTTRAVTGLSVGVKLGWGGVGWRMFWARQSKHQLQT